MQLYDGKIWVWQKLSDCKVGDTIMLGINNGSNYRTYRVSNHIQYKRYAEGHLKNALDTINHNEELALLVCGQDVLVYPRDKSVFKRISQEQIIDYVKDLLLSSENDNDEFHDDYTEEDVYAQFERLKDRS